MAGLGWNVRHGNMPGLNHARQRPYNPTQIACRICDQVFTSTQTLINHIESHMREDEASSRRHHEVNFMSPQTLTNTFQPNLSLLTHTQMQPPIQNGYNFPVLQERNPFLGANPQIIAPRATPPTQSQLSMLGRNNFAPRPQPVPSGALQVQHRVVEEPPNDCTKPFLKQLEQTMPSILELLQSHDDNNVKSHVEMLDLTLKL